jgi:hypothetical protein
LNFSTSAIITANPGSGLYALVKEHHVGLLVNTESEDALKECIQSVVSNDFREVKHCARVYAEETLSTNKILHSYEAFIKNGKSSHTSATSAPSSPISELRAAEVARVRSKMRGIADSNPS